MEPPTELRTELTSQELATVVIDAVEREPTEPTGLGMHRIIASLFEQYAAQAIAVERERSIRLETIARQAVLVGYSCRDDNRSREWMTEELAKLQGRIRSAAETRN